MKKGFTLVELLAVIVILAIILAIAVPGISSIIESSQINAFKSNERMLLKAAKTYIGVDESYLPTDIGDTSEITLETLKVNKYISEIKNPADKTKSCNGYVLITKIDENKYDYSPQLSCESNLTLDGYVNDGLIAYFKLNGNAYDYSPNNKHGTIYGSANSTTDRHGNPEGALEFDGINDYIIFPTVNTGNSNWTVTLWFKTNSSSNKWLITNSSGGPVANAMYIYNAKIAYQHYYGEWITNYGNTTITNNKWHLLAWVNRANGTIDFYVDGIKEVSGIVSTIANSGPLNIIGRNWGETYFLGALSDIRFYNRAFSDNEVKSLYNTEKF